VKEILSESEINWLNAYHKTCEEKLLLFGRRSKRMVLELVSPLIKTKVSVKDNLPLNFKLKNIKQNNC
jgi:hypothetical protein